jgi:hypothetical protein
MNAETRDCPAFRLGKQGLSQGFPDERRPPERKPLFHPQISQITEQETADERR